MNARLDRRLIVGAVVGLAGCLTGLLIDPRAMLAAYLVAWNALAAIPIGALAILLITYLVRAGWTQDLHDPLAGAALTLPMTAILFLPILIGADALFPWAHDPGTLTRFKAIYLTPTFFALRAIVYFIVWTGLAIWATRTYRQGRDTRPVAAIGLIVWALAASWAGVDWFESIEPHFHSSIYGLLIVSFDLAAGFSFGLLMLLGVKRGQTMSNSAYAGVLLSVLLLWAYLHAMQYIIIWAGNIPDEVIWYQARTTSGWGAALAALFAIQFVVPFFLLLSARLRANSRFLLRLAGLTLACRYLEAALLILPPLHLSPLATTFGLGAAVLATTCIWLLALIFAIRRLPGRTAERLAAADQDQSPD